MVPSTVGEGSESVRPTASQVIEDRVFTGLDLHQAVIPGDLERAAAVSGEPPLNSDLGPVTGNIPPRAPRPVSALM